MVRLDVFEAPAEFIDTGLGTNIAKTPVGRVLVESVMLPVKPPRLVIVSRSGAEEEPTDTVMDVVAAVSVKSLTVNGSQALVTPLLLASPL